MRGDRTWLGGAPVVALLTLLGCSAGGGSTPAAADDAQVVSGADGAVSAQADAAGGATDTTAPSDDGVTDLPTDDATTPPEADATVTADVGGTGLGGECPIFLPGTMTFRAADLDRTITVTLPPESQGAGVLFLWHGFGDTGAGFSSAVGAAGIGKAHNVITVSAQAALDPFETEKLAPYKDLAAQFIGPMPPTWAIIDGPEMDMALFDGVLACLDERFQVDRSRIYTMGFSQGALWSTVLVLKRSEQIASALLWSGGLGYDKGLLPVVRFTYETPARRIPVLAASGGVADVWPNAQLALVDFTAGTQELVDALRADGHATASCNHGLGHTIPFDGLQWGLKFLFDHTLTPDGQSHYFGFDGTGFPAYCDFPAAPQ